MDATLIAPTPPYRALIFDCDGTLTDTLPVHFKTWSTSLKAVGADITVDMLAQSKLLVDAAKKAGVKHIVHLGIFAPWDTTIHYYIWHQLIECYIEASGIAWTHLHPNFFMENLLAGMPIKDGSFSLYFGDAKVGWIALEDVAAVAATILREGSEKHGAQNYWFSTESLNGYEVAAIISEVTEKPCQFEAKRPEQLIEDIDSDSLGFEPTYFRSGQDFMQQVFDVGRAMLLRFAMMLRR